MIKGTIVEIEKQKISGMTEISSGHYSAIQKLTKLKINGELFMTKAELLKLILEVMTIYQEKGVFMRGVSQYDLTLDTTEVQ